MMQWFVNLDSCRDWTVCRETADAMKTSRPFGVPNMAQPWDSAHDRPVTIPLDADGNPLADWGSYISTVPVPPGTYNFSIESGQGTLSGTATVNGKLQPIPATPIAAGKTYPITVPAGCTQLFLQMTGTNGSVRRPHLWRPGTSNTSPTFSAEFLNALALFAGIRAMDWTNTNINPATSFAKVGNAANVQWTDEFGAPLQACIALASAAKGDLWWNCPIGLDAAGQQQAAKLIGAASGDVYVELDNELWNNAFPHAQALQQRAANDPDTAGVPGNEYSSDNSPWTRAWRLAAKLSLAMAKAMKAVNPRLKIVLSMHSDPWGGGVYLDYIRRQGVKVSDYFAAIGCAPYFQPAGPYTLAWVDSTLAGFRKLADSEGVQLALYECGPNNVDVSDADFSAYLATIARYADVACYYKLAATSQGGANKWGLTNDIANLATPKYLALAKAAGTPVPTPPTVTPTPTPTPPTVTPTPTPTTPTPTPAPSDALAARVATLESTVARMQQTLAQMQAGLAEAAQ